MHPDNHSVQRQVEWQSLRIHTQRIAAIAKQGPRVSTISAPLAAPDHVNCAVQTRRAHPHPEPSPERQPNSPRAAIYFLRRPTFGEPGAISQRTATPFLGRPVRFGHDREQRQHEYC